MEALISIRAGPQVISSTVCVVDLIPSSRKNIVICVGYKLDDINGISNVAFVFGYG